MRWITHPHRTCVSCKINLQHNSNVYLYIQLVHAVEGNVKGLKDKHQRKVEMSSPKYDLSKCSSIIVMLNIRSVFRNISFSWGGGRGVDLSPY